MAPDTIVNCVPLFDDVTEITLDENRAIIEYAKEKGIEVIDLIDEDAVQEKVAEALREHPEAMFVHYDHGSESVVWGDDDRPVIDLHNVELLANRECYNNNCSSAKKLGVEAWKRGATYWGYKDVYYFSTDSLEEFKEAGNHGLKLRIDGLSWKECLSKTKEKMTELADKLVKTGRALAGACMRWDRDILVCYDADPPEADCWFRRQAIKFWGPKVGWRLTRKFAWGILLFAVGWTLALWEIYEDILAMGETPLRIHHGWIGLALMMITFIMVCSEFFLSLRQKGWG